MLTAIHKKVSTESPKEIFVFPDPWPSSFASGPGPSPWSSPDSGIKFEFCGPGLKNMFFFNLFVLGLYNVQPSLKGIYKDWDPRPGIHLTGDTKKMTPKTLLSLSYVRPDTRKPYDIDERQDSE